MHKILALRSRFSDVFFLFVPAEDVADHTRKACEAAMLAQSSFKQLSKTLAERGYPNMRFCVGLHWYEIFLCNLSCAAIISAVALLTLCCGWRVHVLVHMLLSVRLCIFFLHSLLVIFSLLLLLSLLPSIVVATAITIFFVMTLVLLLSQYNIITTTVTCAADGKRHSSLWAEKPARPHNALSVSLQLCRLVSL